MTITDPDLSQSKTITVATWADILPDLERAVLDEARLWKTYKEARLRKDTKKVPEDA